MVDSTGHIDFGRRREGASHDPLFTLESLLAIQPYSTDKTIRRAIQFLCDHINRTTANTFKLGKDCSNWSWAARLMKEANRSLEPKTLRNIAEEIAAKRQPDHLWGYDPPWKSNHVPHFISRVVYTGHIVMNLASLASDIPDDLVAEAVTGPTYQLLDIAERLTSGDMEVVKTHPLIGSSYGLSILLRAFQAVFNNLQDSQIGKDLSRRTSIEEAVIPNEVMTELRDLTDPSALSTLSREFGTYLSEINYRLDNIENTLQKSSTSSELKWTLPVIPLFLHLKRRVPISKDRYPNIAGVLERIESVLGVKTQEQ